jgi:hypothetical protein
MARPDMTPTPLNLCRRQLTTAQPSTMLCHLSSLPTDIKTAISSVNIFVYERNTAFEEEQSTAFVVRVHPVMTAHSVNCGTKRVRMYGFTYVEKFLTHTEHTKPTLFFNIHV